MSILSKLSAGLRWPFDGIRDKVRRRRARRAAEESATNEKLAERLIAEELARRERLVEEHAREEEAAKRREAEMLARQTRLAKERADGEAARQRASEEEAAHQRRMGNPFEVGGRYENRKGPFTVIELTDNEVRIRWDSGEEIVATIESQQRILRNMRRGDIYCDADSPITYPAADSGSPVARYRPTVEYCSYCGRELTSPKYYHGLPYGATCIKYARRE